MYLKPLHLPKAHILVLEDDSILRAGLCSLLSEFGYALVEGIDGARAAGAVDLVLAGVTRRQTPKAALGLLGGTAPVILMIDQRAWNGFDFLDAANDLGAVAVLQRPFTRSVLLRLVSKVLSEPRGAAPSLQADEPDSRSLAEILVQPESSTFI
jgi:DNA-binding response OmpR family regulator